MTNYYKFYKTRSKVAVDRIKQLEDEKARLAVELANARVELVDMGHSLESALESLEKQLYEQKCDNIRLLGAVGALERVTVAAMNGDK